jgi:hypothetical protein
MMVNLSVILKTPALWQDLCNYCRKIITHEKNINFSSHFM